MAKKKASGSIVAKLKSSTKPKPPQWYDKRLDAAGRAELEELKVSFNAGELGDWSVTDVFREFEAKYGKVCSERNFRKYILGR